MTEIQFDEIKKALHYNLHPSGVEAIDLCRFLPFSLGNAVKILFRMHLKGSHEKDLRKAQYYFADHLAAAEEVKTPARCWLRLDHWEWRDAYLAPARQVILHETDPVAGRTFGAFLLNPWDARGVQLALEIVTLELLKIDEQRAADAAAAAEPELLDFAPDGGGNDR